MFRYMLCEMEPVLAMATALRSCAGSGRDVFRPHATGGASVRTAMPQTAAGEFRYSKYTFITSSYFFNTSLRHYNCSVAIGVLEFLKTAFTFKKMCKQQRMLLYTIADLLNQPILNPWF